MLIFSLPAAFWAEVDGVLRPKQAVAGVNVCLPIALARPAPAMEG
jgi:hypothetical protein